MNPSFAPPNAPCVAVLGDVMLDEWIVGAATRISPEAPVPVLKFGARRVTVGGAANVAANISSLGATLDGPLRARVCGLLGTDAAGDDVLQTLRALGVEAHCLSDAARPTTLKTRIVAGTQQVARVDREDDAPLAPALSDRLCDLLAALLDGARLLCVSDYAKGVTSREVVARAHALARERGLPVAGGPKPRNLGVFAGFDFLSFNLKEAREAAGAALRDDVEVASAGEALRAGLEARALVVTRGAKGATLCEEGREPVHLHGHEVEVFDVAGAGDTFLAAACVALARGATAREAANQGNAAAAASVRHSGVVAVTPAEVGRLLRDE